MSNIFFCNFCRIQFTNDTEFYKHWQLLHACEKGESPNFQQNPVIALPATHILSLDLETKNNLLRSARAPPELFHSFKFFCERNKKYELLGDNKESLLKSVTLLEKMQSPIAPPTLSVSASGISHKLGDNREGLLKTISWLQKMTSAPPTHIAPPALYHCVICDINLQDHSDFESHLIENHWFTGS